MHAILRQNQSPVSGLLGYPTYVESIPVLGWRGTGHNGGRGEEKGTLKTGWKPCNQELIRKLTPV